MRVRSSVRAPQPTTTTGATSRVARVAPAVMIMMKKRSLAVRVVVVVGPVRAVTIMGRRAAMMIRRIRGRCRRSYKCLRM